MHYRYLPVSTRSAQVRKLACQIERAVPAPRREARACWLGLELEVPADQHVGIPVSRRLMIPVRDHERLAFLPQTHQTVSMARPSPAAAGVTLALMLGLLAPTPWPPLSAAAASAAGPMRVVINEIMYHPPDERDDLQFVELINYDTNRVNLSGWVLTNGIAFAFPRQTELPAGGCVVVCRDIMAFKSYYGDKLNLAGAFTGKLSHKGGPLKLIDPQGQVVDAVPYSDRKPWPLGPDGYGASLERICPMAPGDDPDNWTSSEVKPSAHLVGTPGRPNAAFSALPPPRVAEVTFGKPEPDKPIAVTATAADDAGVASVALVWGAWAGEGAISWTETPMTRQSGDARRGVYSGTIPAQPEGRLIRFAIHAKNAAGVERIHPSKTEPRPTFSCGTFVNTNEARIAFLKLLTPGGIRPGSTGNPRLPHRARVVVGDDSQHPTEPMSSWASAAVYQLPGENETQVFDYLQVRPRRGGLKVHFHKDQPLGELTSIDMLFKGKPRYVLSEVLAQELYRRAGIPAPMTQQVRLWLGQRLLGYYLVVEHPNKSFLRRYGRDPDGNVYKLAWYGNGLIGQHEKQNNPLSGHDDLVQVVENLNRLSGAAQWDFIQQHFNVDEMINYCAVSMCLQNWDGFWNNYFAYHDLRPGGKWEVYPWDEDKTWGDHDGSSPNYDWYEMPLTFGMNGAKVVGNRFFGEGPFGGASWWRPPGHFYGPLLANPEFRRRFLDRLREMCDTLFTPETMGPIIRALAQRLEPEVTVRAQCQRQNPAAALDEFRRDIQSFHNQVINRRKFILNQLDAQKP